MTEDSNELDENVVEFPEYTEEDLVYEKAKFSFLDFFRNPFRRNDSE